MTIKLKQSTASQEIPLGYFVDSTDGNSEETGLTIANTDIKLWKAGATTLANKNSGGATHIANGIYYCVLDATDTDTLGPLVIFIHVAGALAVRVECEVLAANVYDSLIAASDKLQVHADEITNGLITAAAIADNAIDAGSIAADAITAAKIADGAIDAGTFAAGAITASAIAADAIGASELAADAVAEIADAVWDEAISGHLGAGSTGEKLNGASAPSAAAVADAVWEEALADHSGTSGSTAEQLAAAGAAGDPWATALPGAYGAGTAGKIIGDNINATVSSRASQTSVDTIDDFLDTEVAAIKAKTDQLTFSAANKLDANLKSIDEQATNGNNATLMLKSLHIWNTDALGNAVRLGTDDGHAVHISATDGNALRLVAEDEHAVYAIATGAVDAVRLVGAGGRSIHAADGIELADGTLSLANVKAQTVAALATDTYGEPTGAPGATVSLKDKLGYLYMALRNKLTITSSTKNVHDDAGNVEFSKALSDNGTTYTEDEAA